MPPYCIPLEKRFLSKFTASLENSCWVWNGGKHKKLPYGTIHESAPQGIKGKNLLAHRLSFFIFRGQIPSGLFVCHSCDNYSCVRPSHFFLGNNSVNQKDAFRKGRSNRQMHPELFRGERHPHHKLKASHVLKIRKASSEGCSIGALSKKYAVARATIHDILKGIHGGGYVEPLE